MWITSTFLVGKEKSPGIHYFIKKLKIKTREKISIFVVAYKGNYEITLKNLNTKTPVW